MLPRPGDPELPKPGKPGKLGIVGKLADPEAAELEPNMPDAEGNPVDGMPGNPPAGMAGKPVPVVDGIVGISGTISAPLASPDIRPGPKPIGEPSSAEAVSVEAAANMLAPASGMVGMVGILGN